MLIDADLSVLDSRSIASLICEIEDEQDTGRPGYPVRSLVAVALIREALRLRFLTQALAHIEHNERLRAIIGEVPTKWACYRFETKLTPERRRFIRRAVYAKHTMPKHMMPVSPEVGAEVADLIEEYGLTRAEVVKVRDMAIVLREALS